MKALIIDDENKSRRLLETLLKDFCPEISTIFQATDLINGISVIENEAPELVFLDIEMPKHSGLEILSFFDNKEVNFQIIFVTAYNQYALEAFKLSAVDYLLKPVDIDELKTAVEKAINTIQNKSINNQFEDLKKAFKQLSLNKLTIEVSNGILFVSHDEIYFLEADGMYTKIHLKENKTELVSKPLKHFVSQLENKVIFYKPHRSYLINLKHIKSFSKKDGFHLTMDNGKTIPIAKDKKKEFLLLIQEFF